MRTQAPRGSPGCAKSSARRSGKEVGRREGAPGSMRHGRLGGGGTDHRFRPDGSEFADCSRVAPSSPHRRWSGVSFPCLITPNLIGRGGPEPGIVTSAHNSSPAGRIDGSGTCSGMKNARGSASRAVPADSSGRDATRGDFTVLSTSPTNFPSTARRRRLDRRLRLEPNHPSSAGSRAPASRTFRAMASTDRTAGSAPRRAAAVHGRPPA